MSVYYECCELSGRGLCDELITRPEDSYRLCCVVVCDTETSKTRGDQGPPWAFTPQGKRKCMYGACEVEMIELRFSPSHFVFH